MKQTIFITTLSILFSFLMNSCAVTEDITFKKNKEVEYNMTIDLSQLMALGGSGAPDSPNFGVTGFSGLEGDSIISFVDQFSKDSLDITDPEIAEDIENIRPLYMRMEKNSDSGKFALSIFGKFKNAEAFNKAFVSFVRIDQYQKALKNTDAEMEGSPASDFSPNDLFKNNSISWDGKVMKRLTNQVSNIEKTESSGSEEESVDQLMDKMTNSLAPILNKTRITTNYHFEKKVKDTNRTDATFSKDGKTVTISYTGEDSLNPEKNTPIEIKVK